jgi:glycerol-3-phosphate dehydrogenase
MNRKETFQALAQAGVVDLIVIGGGATGLGVALDAALRGYSVVVLESHDFAGGTSSRSTKLLHGGVRYLAQGNVSLVREALHERRAILNIAPHVTAPLPFVMPAYAWWKVPFYGIGLKLYDLLAGRAGLGRTEWLTGKETQALLPGVQARGLHGGVKYWDAQFDDARLALAIARSAQEAGAALLNYTRVEGLQALTAQTDGARWAVAWRDQRAGLQSVPVDRAHREGRDDTEPPAQPQGLLRARCVVNAAGVWVDDLIAQAQSGRATRRMVTPSQGVHLVVDKCFLAGDSALLVPKTKDGRVLFAVPWMGALILGTTDTQRHDAPREPEALDEEIEFILREAAHVLTRAPTRADVRSVWVGLRPLVTPDSSKATRSISREHTIEVSDQGLLTVTGGKWTTYRAMADDVMQHIDDHQLLPRRGKSGTAAHTLVGGSVHSGVAMTQAPGLHLYGDCAAQVLACEGAEEDLGAGLSAAMVRYAVRSEFAQTVEDVLARRWRVLFLDAAQAARMAPRVAQIVAEETGADPELAAFVALCARYQLTPQDPLTAPTPQATRLAA